MEFKNKILMELEKKGLWTVVTFKTPHGPRTTMEKLAKAVEEGNWRVTFKANWWTADIPYGLIRLDLERDGREKILLGKWVLGERCELIRLETMDLERGKDEFFRMVDSITSTLIYDPVIRTMREQY
ncbi:ribonucleoside-triphosphate reductase [Thermococcus sp.]|uniref:ribonucleoside-triphosphate reductase n=1 Tax=Thermococcus sp. TaxID=35749 RepID=UPI00260D04C8|nr:ribonucleoside-triphosphate reductase [Thermococcus sp.]